MLDHLGINVSDIGRSKAFYEKALAPLGIETLMAPVPGMAGLGSPKDHKPFFWLSEPREPTTTNVHIAFASPDRATVDAFHEAALAAGGTDNGAPGIREIYHPNYYGAFVLDPDGNNVEACCHTPES